MTNFPFKLPVVGKVSVIELQKSLWQQYVLWG